MSEEQAEYRADLQDETLAAVYGCVRRLAVDGVAPGRIHYDRNRDEGLPASVTLWRRHGLTWLKVVHGAGLQMSARALGQQGQSHRVKYAAVPDDVEEYIRQAFGLGLNAEDYRHVPEGLAVLPSSQRVEVREFEQRGVWVRVEREIVALR